jgi:hypothetical protein
MRPLQVSQEHIDLAKAVSDLLPYLRVGYVSPPFELELVAHVCKDLGRGPLRAWFGSIDEATSEDGERLLHIINDAVPKVVREGFDRAIVKCVDHMATLSRNHRNECEMKNFGGLGMHPLRIQDWVTRDDREIIVVELFDACRSYLTGKPEQQWPLVSEHDKIIHYMKLTSEDGIFLDGHADVWKEGQPQ